MFVFVVVVCSILTFGGLTLIGAFQRGMDALPALAAAVFFPVTWMVWYVRDEHPYRRA